MATLNTRDPVQGLIDYVQDVKPFHTKILEVWVEYLYGDPVEGTVTDKVDIEIQIDLDRSRNYCDYGWDMQVWGKMLADLDIEEILPGSITYASGQSITRAAAYQLYFDYMVANWRWSVGGGPQPVISTVTTSKFYILSFATVINPAKAYFTALSTSSQYWYEPTSAKLYKQSGSAWVSQAGFISTYTPTGAVEGQLWVNTVTRRLFVYHDGVWVRNPNFYTAYAAPTVIPVYPTEWISGWDQPDCTPPYGETWAHATVIDDLVFTIENANARTASARFSVLKAVTSSSVESEDTIAADVTDGVTSNSEGFVVDNSVGFAEPVLDANVAKTSITEEIVFKTV